MPATPPAIEAVLRAAARASQSAQKRRGSTSVIRLDRAISCCERNEVKVIGDVQALLLGIIDQIQQIKRGEALAFVPLAGSRMITRLSAAEVAAFVGAASGAATVAGVAIPAGAVVLGAYALLEPLIDARATYETMSLVGQALGAYQRTRMKTKTKVSDCEVCMRENALNQKHPRHRERVKILRRQ